MKKICLLIAITAGSWIGWELGASLGVMTAYWCSFVGSLLGVFVGYFFNQRYLD